MQVVSHLFQDQASLSVMAAELATAPAAVMLLSAGKDAEQIEAVLGQIQELWPEAETIGATTARLILDGGEYDDGIGLFLISGNDIHVEAVSIGMGSINLDRGKIAGELMMARAMSERADVIFSFSTLAETEVRDFIKILENRFGSCPLVGGGASRIDDADTLRVWHNGRILADGIVVLVVKSDDTAVSPNWFMGMKGMGLASEVTAVEGNAIQSFANLNAQQMCNALFGRSLEDDPEAITRSMPLVLLRRGMPVILRMLEFTDDHVLVNKPVRRGEVVRLHAEHFGRVHQQVRNLAERALEKPADAVFYFTNTDRLRSYIRTKEESRPLAVFGPVCGGYLAWQFAVDHGQNHVLTETASVTFTGRKGHPASRRLSMDDIPPVKQSRPRSRIMQVMEDIVDRTWRNPELEKARQENRRIRYQSVLENMSDGVSILTSDGLSLFESRANREIHGFSRDDLLGRSYFDEIIQPDHREAAMRLWNRALKDPGKVYKGEFACRTADGRRLLLDTGIRNCLYDDSIRGVIITFRDITDMRRIEDELRRQATIDSLTGVANRRHFSDMASAEITRSIRYQHPLSFAIFDIDHFKRFNDRYGHQTGDDVLILVSTFVRASMRKSDVIGRLGGEEFGILLPETPLAGAIEKADILRELIASEGLQVGDDMLKITASFGVAQLREEESMDQVMHRADLALYEAKETGRNKVWFNGDL